MGRRLGSFLVVLAAHVGSACAGDTITMGRADTGILPGDGGQSNPLALQKGMAFTYRGILAYRDAQLGAELHSTWTMKLTITDAFDAGSAPNSDSTVKFAGSDVMATTSGWMPTADFDSWVGQLGPSLSTDQVDAQDHLEHLAQVPKMPLRQPSNKSVPGVGTFFMDTRLADGIRARFAQEHMAQMAQTVDPGMNGGHWLFSFDGPDTANITYYPDRLKTRSIRLEYDPRGFLYRLEETIGDTTMRPNANCRIELVSGP